MRYLFYSLAITVETLSSVIFFVLLINAISSWVPALYHSKFGQIIRKLAYPILFPFKKILNRISFFRNLPVDLSPVFAIVVIDVLVGIISAFLRTAAAYL